MQDLFKKRFQITILSTFEFSDPNDLLSPRSVFTNNYWTDWFFKCITPRHYTKECGYLLIHHALSIFNNNNMTSQNFNSFSEKNFFRTLMMPSCCNISHIFIKKTSVVANVNVAAIFTQHFVWNYSQFVILWQLRTFDWVVNNI